MKHTKKYLAVLMAISILLCSIIAITSFAANSSQGDNEAEIEELQPVMASRCSYPLVSGYYGRPGESGGSMRVMDGGIENAESFFTFLTGQVAVYNTTVSIPGGGTARITPSNTAGSGFAVQITTGGNQPFKSQRVHFN